MRGLGILILVVLFFWIVWPYIARWLKRKAIERAENYVRSSMGMPPRDKKQQNRSNRNSREDYFNRGGRNPYGNSQNHGPIIPKEYAEDVEYTETIDYSQSERRVDSNGEQTYHESQISDAEWVEIKKSGSK